jgi:uncharacterized membrane protein
MKIEANKTIIEVGSSNVGHWMAEPFLFIGLALFWAITLPIVGVVFAFGAAIEEALVYLRPLRTAFKVSPRMSQHAA